MIESVIFDLDGTLLYTLEDLQDSVNYALRKYGYKERTLDEISSFVGNGTQQLIKQALPQDIGEEAFVSCYKTFRDYYSEHCCVKTRPYDNIINVLEVIKDKGIKLGVISNKYQSAAEEVCHHYFNDLFDVVIGESENCKRKPSPDGLNMICEKFGIKKENVYFFGDSEVDIKAAENAGIFCISVLWGYRSRDFLTKNGAKLFIKDPYNILSLLDGLK